MASAGIIEKIKHLKDLEEAGYVSSQILDRLNNDTHSPQKPVKPERTVKYKPTETEVNTGAGIGFGIVFIIVGIALSAWIISQCDDVFPFVAFVFILICIGLSIFGICIIRKSSSLKNDYRVQYLNELDAYNKSEKKYKSEMDKYEKDYAHYNNSLAIYQQNKSNTVACLTQKLNELPKELNRLYDECNIFPKYRNIVAISAFLEYLSSGRCESLEGVNGAYNLYETEKRQNIVIDQLSIITNNLAAIMNNQYILYTTLSSANTTINNVMNEVVNSTEEISDNTALSAYYDELNYYNNPNHPF